MEYPDNLFYTIDDSIRGKKIVIRIDINSTVDEHGEPLDTARIDAAIEVLHELIAKGARVTALAHFGEKGESLATLASFMQKRLPCFRFEPSLDPKEIRQSVEKLKDGEVVLLENVRKFPGETDNDDGLSRFFASLGNEFINDAFPVNHRKHASVYGITSHIRSSFGPVMRRELFNLSKALSPEFPCLLILGGSKLSTKLPLIEVYLRKGCFVYVGGAMVHNILKARNFEIGDSLYDPEFTVSSYVLEHEKLIVPEDVVLDSKETVDVRQVKPGQKIFDCGPKTIATLKDMISRSHTVIMNGPVGYYEGGFKQGTEDILALLEKGVSLTTILGGGDTLTVYNTMEKKPRMTFVSLGGGAMLDYLKDGTLPGIEAVVKSRGMFH